MHYPITWKSPSVSSTDAFGFVGGAGSGVMSALDVRGVTVHFGGVAALLNVSLSARRGAVTGLIGPNGAGKTTLFNVISGLQRPDHGEVRLSHQDVTRRGPHRRAQLGLARTFQRLELFSTLTARDNVRVGLEATSLTGIARRGSGDRLDRRADELLERVGVAHVADHLVGSLPTGSARLVELARAMAIDPGVLLLDEPGSGLDESETAVLGDLLVTLARGGMAVVLVEHDTELVLRICDAVNVLDFGQIIAVGPPAEVRQDPAVQAAYLGSLNEGAA
jgi:branched-chain amino acid transport system ATP-binding protein